MRQRGWRKRERKERREGEGRERKGRSVCAVINFAEKCPITYLVRVIVQYMYLRYVFMNK